MCAWSVIAPEYLETIEFFEQLDEQERLDVASLMSLETWRRNDRIIAEGTVGDRIYFIVDGAVRVSRTIPGIGEEALAILGPGSYFGEMSLFGDDRRSADVFADRRSSLLAVDVEELKALLDAQPRLAARFLWNVSKTLARRMRESNAKVTFLSVAGKFEENASLGS
jgi:CRP/FNR family cyclic AMP-dependent transcriptional regulator